MKKQLLFLLFTVAFLKINAQDKLNYLINGEFISNIGYSCEETSESAPCAGTQMYLILNFTTENVIITEKDISSCGAEYITSKQKYKWELTPDSIELK